MAAEAERDSERERRAESEVNAGRQRSSRGEAGFQTPWAHCY